MKKDEDGRWMQEAISEAQKGIGLTSPNPPVGAVIVRDGEELARGWHQKVGRPHAEREALAKLTAPAEGATIYVTLEPCSTQGLTGACTEALIESGISRVVYGACDPNLVHAGGADAILREHGIEVTSGVHRAQCGKLIRGFAKVQTQGLPWIIAKTAMSLDGRITRPPGEGQWLTGTEAREDVQLLRSEVDAIITSGETVRCDNPALTLRSGAIFSEKQQPLRVVLTNQGLKKEDYQIFNDGGRTLMFKNESLQEVLRQLATAEKVNTVLLECGGHLMGTFLDEGLLDEMAIYLAPLVTGGPSPALGGNGAENLTERFHLKDLKIRQLGRDLVARGIVSQELPPLQR